jgi:hypothetical protein
MPMRVVITCQVLILLAAFIAGRLAAGEGAGGSHVDRLARGSGRAHSRSGDVDAS